MSLDSRVNCVGFRRRVKKVIAGVETLRLCSDTTLVLKTQTISSG